MILRYASRAAAAAIGAGIAAVALAVILWPNLFAVHPPRCSWASDYGDFCVTWNDDLGRYNPPPDGIPADFSRPEPTRDAPRNPWIPAAAILLVVASFTWLGTRAILARRPSDIHRR